jgi:hypothetical protein
VLRHKTGAIKERKRRCHHQKKNRRTRRKNKDRGAQTAYNSGYMVPLRSTQIFAPLRSAKTSYSRRTLCDIFLGRNLETHEANSIRETYLHKK